MTTKKKLIIRRKPEEQEKSGRPKAVGAYIFAGLFTVGVRKHFDVLAHLEDGPFGTATARRNFPGMEVYEDPDEWPVLALQGERPDFVYANPPCAPWSVANGKGGSSWKEDPRTSCVARTFDLLRKLRPKVWTFESVRGAYTKGREMVDEMAAEAAKLGYSTTHLLVDANNHGVAQVRRRYFMVCHRVEIKFPPSGLDPVTVGQALRGVPEGKEWAEIPPRFNKIMPGLKQGARLRDVFDARASAGVNVIRKENGHVKGRPGFLINRLDESKPSPVLTGSATKIHPRKDRFISIEESKAICGLPRDFQFEGSLGNKYAQLAKAVMPPVGEYVAACAAEAIKRNVKVSSPTVRQVVVHKDIIELTKMVTPA